MTMMMIVDLYSALRRAPLLRYVSRCIVKRNVFSAARKDPMLSDGSRRWSGSRFQTIGPATENARRPNLLRRWRGTISWGRVADRRRWWPSMSGVGMQQSIKYWGALPCKHRWTITPNLYWTRWGTSNQCSSVWSRHIKLHVPVTTRSCRIHHNAWEKECRQQYLLQGSSCPLQPFSRQELKPS